MFRVLARKPTGDYSTRRHGNWKNGEYSKSQRQSLREFRAIIALLGGRISRNLPARCLQPPPGWRMYPFERRTVD